VEELVDGGMAKLGVGEQRLSAPPATGRAPTRAVNSGKAPGVVGSAWVVVYWCGGNGRRQVGLAWGKLVIEVVGAAIYMGFCPLSCATRSRSRIYLQSNFNSFFLFGFRLVSMKNTVMGKFCFCFFVLESGRKATLVLGCC
jgi:hypothetical protein